MIYKNLISLIYLVIGAFSLLLASNAHSAIRVDCSDLPEEEQRMCEGTGNPPPPPPVECPEGLYPQKNGSCKPYLAQVKLLTYNTWLLDTDVPGLAASHRELRAKMLGKVLKNSDYDIIALQETFDDSAADLIFKATRFSHPYRIKQLPEDPSALKMDGGLSFISKHKLLFEWSFPWKTCSSTDCYANKGFVYTKVNAGNGVFINLINAHLNADGSQLEDLIFSFKKTRKEQLHQLKSFVLERNEVNIMKLFIYMGDFNIDGPISNSAHMGDEYNTLKQILGVGIRDAWLESGVNYSSSCGYEFGYTHMGKELSVSPSCPSNYFTSDSNVRLDYILVDDTSINHQKYRVEIKNTKVFRPELEVDLDFGHFTIPKSMDLSDHFGVSSVITVYPKN